MTHTRCIFKPVRPLTYLASPYSHPDATVREARYEHVTRAAAWLIRFKGWNVFSPITHSHPLALIGGLRGDWAFWEHVDREYLEVSQRMVVLTLPGWQESTGVTAEIGIARELGLMVSYLVEIGTASWMKYAICARPMTPDEVVNVINFTYGNFSQI